MVNLYLVFAGIYGISGSFFGFLRVLKFHYDIATNSNHFIWHDGLDEPDIVLSGVVFNALSFMLIGTGFLFGIVGLFYDLSIDSYISWIFSVSEIIIVFLYGFNIYVTRDKKLNSMHGKPFIFFILLTLYYVCLATATLSTPQGVSYPEVGVFLFIFVVIIIFYFLFNKVMGSKKGVII